RMEVGRLADTADEWLGLPPEEAWLGAAATMVQGGERGANQLQRWGKWQEGTQAASALGLPPVGSAVPSGVISADEIASTFELGYARCWIEQIVEREEALRSFVADQHNDTIACFAELDEKIAALAQRVVAGQLSGNLPPRTAFGRDPEFGTLA